ncbi:MAG TPA: hypothetical protein VFV41_15055 [Streptosporangiaceae bacterium]|nr:hypothetical protein [Streptosporangiaceae bacterium]
MANGLCCTHVQQGGDRIMPSASPVPRGPSVLVLGQPGELVTRPGCPACRYVAEAADRYLAWFALEAHGDAGMVTRLSASLGMCAPHTRVLMSQPGAAPRLTVVYRYVLQAVPGQLAARRWRPDPCPACEQAASATGRVLDMVADGLADPGFRSGYAAAGGLCLPHLHAVLRQCRRGPASWLAGVALDRLQGQAWPAALLTGELDPGTGGRARRGAALSQDCPAGGCPACHAALRGEQARLGQAARPGGADAAQCAGHLDDSLAAAGPLAGAMLAVQGAHQAGLLALAQDRRRSVRRRSAAAARGCAVCRERAAAGRRELGRRAAAGAPWPPLCVRHVLELRTFDSGAGEQAAAVAAGRAAVLAAELAEDSGARARQARGAGRSAWRRAAAFLDGAIGATAA